MHDWFISNIIIFDFSFSFQNPEFKVVSLNLKTYYELVMILSPTSLISLPVTLISFQPCHIFLLSFFLIYPFLDIQSTCITFGLKQLGGIASPLIDQFCFEWEHSFFYSSTPLFPPRKPALSLLCLFRDRSLLKWLL